MTAKRSYIPTSGRQRASNRQNAKASTGPVTDEGRAAAAANALRHGIYARSTYAIDRGPFAENQAEIDTFQQAIITALAPEGPLEQAVAETIALALLRHRRHGRLEGVVLGGVGRNTSQLELLYPEVQKEADLRFAITTLGHFSDWLSERCMVPDWVAPQIKAWLEERNELPSVLSAPSGLDALVDLVWAGDMIGAEHWAKHRKAEFQQRLAPIDGITNNSAAMSAINGYLDKLTKIASRLDSGLDRALRRYQELRDNRLGRNEPST